MMNGAAVSSRNPLHAPVAQCSRTNYFGYQGKLLDTIMSVTVVGLIPDSRKARGSLLEDYERNTTQN